MSEQHPVSPATPWKLFLTFFKLGICTFGGGYAMLPLLQEDIVENKHWISDNDMLDMIAVSESTPGPLIINAATFVGYRLAGVSGSITATVGVALPSYLIILIVTVVLSFFRDNIWVDSAFRGLRSCVVVLILNASIKLARKMKWKIALIVFAVIAFFLCLFTDINTILIILASAVIGILYSVLKPILMKNKK